MNATVEASHLSTGEARKLTDEVKADAVALWAKLLSLYEGGAHIALGYSSWAEYCGEEFGMGKSHAYRVLDAARVIDALGQSPNGDSPSEAVARELSSTLKEEGPDAARDIYQKVVEEYEKPTAKQVREKVEARKRKSTTTKVVLDDDTEVDGEIIDPEPEPEEPGLYYKDIQAQKDAAKARRKMREERSRLIAAFAQSLGLRVYDFDHYDWYNLDGSRTRGSCAWDNPEYIQVVYQRDGTLGVQGQPEALLERANELFPDNLRDWPTRYSVCNTEYVEERVPEPVPEEPRLRVVPDPEPEPEPPTAPQCWEAVDAVTRMVEAGRENADASEKHALTQARMHLHNARSSLRRFAPEAES